MKQTPAPEPSKTILTVKIENELFLLPSGKNINEVLEALAGIRRVRDESFYYMKPNRRVVVDFGEADISVTSAKRELITEAEYETLREAESKAREEQDRKWREKEAATKEGK